MTNDRLLNVIDYDPRTGLFTWKSMIGKRASIGKIAGTVNKKGYVRIQIDKHVYSGHHLAWLYIYGYLPENQIDHINGNRSDNRILNLRECSNNENAQNRKRQKNNSTGFIGVSFHKQRNKYSAQIKINQKLNHLGLFNTPEEAHQAYVSAKKQFHLFNPEIRR